MCRSQLAAIVSHINPVWQDLCERIAKSRQRQREAWDALLKVAGLPTRADYIRRSQEKDSLPKVVAAASPQEHSAKSSAEPPKHHASAKPPPPKRTRSSSSSSTCSKPQFASWAPFSVKDGIEHRVKKRQTVAAPWRRTYTASSSTEAPWHLNASRQPKQPPKQMAAPPPPLMRGPPAPIMNPIMQGPPKAAKRTAKSAANIPPPPGSYKDPSGNGFLRIPMPPKVGVPSTQPRTVLACCAIMQCACISLRAYLVKVATCFIMLMATTHEGLAESVATRGGSPVKRKLDALYTGPGCDIAFNPSPDLNPSCLFACLCFLLGKPISHTSIDSL
eukprot:3799790-Amphidinium_carterae.3